VSKTSETLTGDNSIEISVVWMLV